MTNEKKMDKLLVAVVQSQDGDLAEQVLKQADYSFGKLPSVGGFLRERNVTFLIGCTEAQIPELKDLVGSAAKQRISYLSMPIDTVPYPIVLPSETIIGGVTFFTFDLDHFEEF